MGNAPSSPLQTCLSGVFAANPNLAVYPSHINYNSWVDTYNLAIPVKPTAVIRPTTVQQISDSVRCAATHNVKVQARSGGHSYANYCLGGTDGALVVDLVNFQKFEMNNSTWVATVGGGTLLGDLTERLHNAGKRAIAHGTCPQVGVGGHATIGGLGPSSRQWGSTLDHVLEAEVVLANGTVVRASPTQNEDVFFAIRGAAASFGVVTEFKFRTQPEPAQAVHFSYTLIFGNHRSLKEPFRRWQTLISDPKLDRRLSTLVIIHELGMLISGTFFGTREEYNALRFEEQLKEGAIVNVIVFKDWLGGVAHWAETEALKIVGGIPGPFYSKSLTFSPQNTISAGGIDALFNYLDDVNKGTLIWFLIFDLEGGAINDVPLGASAYAHRDTLFYMQSYAIGIGGLSTRTRNFIQGINDVITTSMPGVDFGAYAGYVDPYLPNGQQAYWGSNYPRLRQIKRAIDPQNVFANPQSVVPA